MDIDKNADMPDTSSLASKGKVKEDVSLTANASVKNPETATPASTTTPKPIVHLTKREEEFMRKDKNLAEFLPMLDDLEPLIPDSVTDYYLARSGFAADDIRM
ncbi:9207_t:CDS:2 [Paraglomus occultum]|uniref:9207_t:CDS:1 n=1 Tax=Paraglomus occultum TaxID=144539 RepID=A0A9N9D579_9GLOM|nr:9207_t:CDS:2 [Paraglomus occultum]